MAEMELAVPEARQEHEMPSMLEALAAEEDDYDNDMLWKGMAERRDTLSLLYSGVGKEYDDGDDGRSGGGGGSDATQKQPARRETVNLLFGDHANKAVVEETSTLTVATTTQQPKTKTKTKTKRKFGAAMLKGLRSGALEAAVATLPEEEEDGEEKKQTAAEAEAAVAAAAAAAAAAKDPAKSTTGTAHHKKKKKKKKKKKH